MIKSVELLVSINKNNQLLIDEEGLPYGLKHDLSGFPVQLEGKLLICDLDAYKAISHVPLLCNVVVIVTEYENLNMSTYPLMQSVSMGSLRGRPVIRRAGKVNGLKIALQRIQTYTTTENVVIIGGAHVAEEAMAFASQLYVNHEADPQGIYTYSTLPCPDFHNGLAEKDWQTKMAFTKIMIYDRLLPCLPMPKN